MTTHDLARACMSADGDLRAALRVIDQFAHSVALITDEQGALAGLLTDGDVRRALLAGSSLEDPALPVATRTPLTCRSGSPRSLVLDLMRAKRITVVPEVDAAGRLVGLHTLNDIVGGDPLPNVAVVMAGGKGTRLGAITASTPKPLVSVAGRSILEWIVLNLVGGGVREVYISVNHLADQVVDHLADGSQFGCTIRYLHEDPDRPLGTAGSLALLRAVRPQLREPVIVMNGDLMVDFDARELLRHHGESGAALTIGVRPYQHRVPFGVVELDAGGNVTAITEKPTVTMDINAAVYAVSPPALALVPAGACSSMPELARACLQQGMPVRAWPLQTEWIDVGTPQDLARARGLIAD